MNWLNIITGGLGAVNDIVKTAFGSREARDQNAAAENAAAMQQYAAEFAVRAQRTWFDSLVDGINRMQRPTYTFSTLGVFWLAYKNPAEFARIMASLALIPEQFWIIVGMIVGFLFSSRMIEKLPVSQGFRPITDEQIKRIRAVTRELPGIVENPSIDAWKSSRKVIAK